MPSTARAGIPAPTPDKSPGHERQLTPDVQRVEEAGVPLAPALQVRDEGQRGPEQAVEVLAAAQQHDARVSVQVLHCWRQEGVVTGSRTEQRGAGTRPRP